MQPTNAQQAISTVYNKQSSLAHQTLTNISWDTNMADGTGKWVRYVTVQTPFNIRPTSSGSGPRTEKCKELGRLTLNYSLPFYLPIPLIRHFPLPSALLNMFTLHDVIMDRMK